MRTEFSYIEIYEAYSQEIYDHLWYVFKVTPEEVEKILDKADFRRLFLEHLEIYEFTEPSKVAEELLERHREGLLK